VALLRNQGFSWALVRKITVCSQSVQRVQENLSQKKYHHKKGLVEWLKV
jgi:hypothetical protein